VKSPVNITNIFSRVYVINLPQRTDRRREMAGQLRRIGLGEREVAWFAAVRPADAGGFPTLGARGCFLSHLGVIEDAVCCGHESILILEDDCNFVPVEQWDHIAGVLRGKQWDMFYGGAKALHGELSPWRGPLARIPHDQAVTLTHFMAFRGDALREVADHLRAMLSRSAGDRAGGPMHVDGAYSWYRSQHPQLRTYTANPQIAVQRASRTDIHALAWHDRVRGVSDLAAVARKMINALTGA
jgi:glycosyl transferase family 25